MKLEQVQKAAEKAIEKVVDGQALSIARKRIETNMTVEQIASITDVPSKTVKAM